MMNMEAYAYSLRRRNILLAAAYLLSLAFMVIVGETALLDSRMLDETMESVQRVFFIWQIVIIWRIIRNARLAKNPGMMKTQILKDGDERRRYIGGMAGRVFAPVFCVLLSIAAIAASFYDKTAFYTLYIVLIAALIFWGALIVYYRRKY